MGASLNMATPSSAGHGRPGRWASVLLLAATACSSWSFPMRPTPKNRIGNSNSLSSRVNRGTVQRQTLYSSTNGSGNDSAFDSGSNNTGNGNGNGGRRKRRKPPRISDKNLYEILGAAPSMSRTEIKRLYITLAKETHPDSFSAATASAATEDRFNEIAQAWTILSDAKTRRAYDRELAARDFKEDVVKRASEVAKEYGPTARKIYDDFAIPFLRRTTATTLASWNAVQEVASSPSEEQQQQQRLEQDKVNNGYKLSGVTLSEVVKEQTEMQRASNANGGLEDFGRAFQRVIEAGRNATRQIDGMELVEKSSELRRRADETRAESMEVLELLTQIKSERLRLTFYTNSANFSATDAMQYLDGFDNGIATDKVTLMRRIQFKGPVRKDIEALDEAETEFERKSAEKMEVDREVNNRQKTLQVAEDNYRSAIESEERARKMLEEAQQRVGETQRSVAEAKTAIRDMYTTTKKAEKEVNNANTVMQRKRDVVRRELKQKANRVEGNVFEVDQQNSANGRTVVQLNPGYDKSGMGLEEQTLANIEELVREEQRIEQNFLQLVDKASRLVSRSERLRIRSEELIGNEMTP